MLSGLFVAAAFLANGAETAGTAAAQASTPPPPAVPRATDSCPPPSADSRVIVVCTQRPQGYRIDPDIMEAKRESHSAGRPVRPGGTIIPDCAHVGPMSCLNPGINLIGAALTAAEMAKRLSEGQEIGSMFLTDPHPSEYQLYVMAKARREAEEAEKAAAKKAKAKAAATAADRASAPQPAGN